MAYTNHSGGAHGADLEWEKIGEAYGVKTIAYSFEGHTHNSKFPRELTSTELNEGAEKAKAASKIMERPWYSIESKPYVRNLISRNWFQVKGATEIFAIGEFTSDKKHVDGGTGWAVQMAITENKPVYFFSQKYNAWFYYDYARRSFSRTDVPVLSKDFAGIGTRDLDVNGKKAIRAVYEKTFKKE